MENTTSNQVRLTPEDYVRMADSQLIAFLREGRYQEVVAAMENLGKYSIRNLMLILRQNPNATNVANMRVWNYHNRSITEGQKGLKILAPVLGVAEKESEDDASDKSGKATGYKINFVFDISQTHGKELAQTRCTSEDAEGYYEGILKTLKSIVRDYTFTEGGKRNSIDYAKKQVAVKDGLSKTDTLKAVIYSIACIQVEGKDREDGKDIAQGKQMFNEVEASAAAYIVSRRLGLGDTKLKTLEFTEQDDEAILKFAGNLHRIRGISQKMINAVEQYLSDARASAAGSAAAPPPAAAQSAAPDTGNEETAKASTKPVKIPGSRKKNAEMTGTEAAL